MSLPGSFEERKFKQLIDVVSNDSGLEVGGSSFDAFTCTYMEFPCDEYVRWICSILHEYPKKISGYRCHAYSDHFDIEEFCGI